MCKACRVIKAARLLSADIDTPSARVDRGAPWSSAFRSAGAFFPLFQALAFSVSLTASLTLSRSFRSFSTALPRDCNLSRKHRGVRCRHAPVFYQDRFFSILRVSTHSAFMERRAHPRKKVLMSGAIELASSHINCLISDMSVSGAVIEVTDPNDIPERFNLVFKANEAHIPCHVVWRQEDRIGVAFD
jgi:PilZ domain